MDIKSVVDEVLLLPRVVETSLDSWNFEQVFQLTLDVAVVVMKKTSSASKDENAALIVSVVSDILGQLKAKALSLADLKKSTEVLQYWNNLETVASAALPVVLSHLNVTGSLTLARSLSLVRSLGGCFSFCKHVSSGVEVVEDVKKIEVEAVTKVEVEKKVQKEVPLPSEKA